MSLLDHNIDIYLALAVTLVVVIITYLLTRKFKKSTNVVLLTGLSDSGKTAIFSKIIFNKPKNSVTSLKENEATVKELNLTIVDLPGADRLRNTYWEQYRTKAHHVIFVIDSTTVEAKLRDLGEYLYLLLSDKTLHDNKIQFSIACNKQDLEGAKKIDQIKPIIEKELNAIKDTRSGQLGKTSNEEVEDYLTKFAEGGISLDNLEVKFIETSVYNPQELIKLIL